MKDPGVEVQGASNTQVLEIRTSVTPPCYPFATGRKKLPRNGSLVVEAPGIESSFREDLVLVEGA